MIDVPLGTVLPFQKGQGIPDGFEIFDGRKLSVEEYPDLHRVLVPAANLWRSMFGGEIDGDSITLPNPTPEQASISSLSVYNEAADEVVLAIRARRAS